MRAAAMCVLCTLSSVAGPQALTWRQCELAGIHGPGGMLGGVLTGIFATEAITGEGSGLKGCLYGGWNQLGLQIYGVVITVVWSSFISWMLLKAIDYTWGLRVALETELLGLDIACHGENLFDQAHMQELKVILSMPARSCVLSSFLYLICVVFVGSQSPACPSPGLGAAIATRALRNRYGFYIPDGAVLV